MTTDSDRNMAVITHLLGIVGAFTLYFGWAPALVIWLIHKDKNPYLEEHCIEALNFQITALLVQGIITLVAIATCGLLSPLIIVVPITIIVCSIIAALQTQKGEMYRYPLTLRLLS